LDGSTKEAISVSPNNVVRKTGLWRNKIKQMQKQTQKTHNTRETQIYVVHLVWATSTREIARSFLYYYPANEGIQPIAKPVVTSSSFSHNIPS
jgi:glycerol-3-phosphate dehydrogenase